MELTVLGKYAATVPEPHAMLRFVLGWHGGAGAMSEFAFGLTSPLDLIGKLEREIGRLGASEEPDSVDHKNQADHAINCALTAWHISDWVFVSGLKTDTVSANSLGNFQKQLIDDCSDLGICKDLANGSKHFKIDRPEQSNVSQTSNRKTVGGGITKSLSKPLVRPLVSSLTGGHTVLLVEVSMKNGGRVKAITLFENVLSYWQEFVVAAQSDA